MVAVPGDIPVTLPEPVPTEAIPGALLLHVPPVVKSLNEVVLPVHTVAVPLMPSALTCVAEISIKNTILKRRTVFIDCFFYCLKKQ